MVNPFKIRLFRGFPWPFLTLEMAQFSQASRLWTTFVVFSQDGYCRWQMFPFRASASKRQQGGWKIMRVLGIDPGLRNLGWGVIDIDGSRLSHVANGTCRSEGTSLATRLLSLYEQLSIIVARYEPNMAAVEQTFVNKDGAATLKLGQARGIALLVPAQAGLEVGEYAPNTVKKTVVGVGHADKAQVAHMVKVQLPGAEIDGPDSADALAIAICHAHHAKSRATVAAALRKIGK